jgi:cytochrome c oxidase accessory protein FixG
MNTIEQELTAKREKITPREVHGIFANARIVAAVGLLGIFYLTPWLQWDGRQAVLLDLPARKFYILGLCLWPQDLLLLVFLLILAAFALFFFTALAGRLWCGYACPQTVWTESFLWIERLVEGSRSQQLKLDRAPWSWRKLRIKGAKHAIWIGFSLYTGFTFVAYFSPARDLFARLIAMELGPWEFFWVGFYAFATYGNAGWMREQVCLYMCPYARFQGAMFDRDTWIISYDEHRGEPRGARPHGAQPPQLGACINCTLCVQVCPTGIDIRDGLQYECIGCAACIDVCNYVMDKMNYPRGLIRYTTQRMLDGGVGRLLRPRIIIYAGLLCVLTALFGYTLVNREPLVLDVIHDRNQLYREAAGSIENVYTLVIVNKLDTQARFQVRATGLPGLTVHLDLPVIDVPAGEVLQVPVRLRAKESTLPARSTPIEFILSTASTPRLEVSTEAIFLGPMP